jgi:hypothetical protein
LRSVRSPWLAAETRHPKAAAPVMRVEPELRWARPVTQASEPELQEMRPVLELQEARPVLQLQEARLAVREALHAMAPALRMAVQGRAARRAAERARGHAAPGAMSARPRFRASTPSARLAPTRVAGVTPIARLRRAVRTRSPAAAGSSFAATSSADACPKPAAAAQRKIVPKARSASTAFASPA